MKAHYVIPDLDPPAVATACGISLAEGPQLALSEVEVNCGGCTPAAKAELKLRLSSANDALVRRIEELERDMAFLKAEYAKKLECSSGKKRHATAAAALDEARRIIKISNAHELACYHCPICDHWHVTKAVAGKDERYVVRSD